MEIAPVPPRRSKATRAVAEAVDQGLTRATQAISIAFIRAAVVLLVLSFSILAMLPLLSEGPSRNRSAAELETVQTLQRDGRSSEDVASANAPGASRAKKRHGGRESLRVAANRASLPSHDAEAKGIGDSDDGEFGFDDSVLDDLATGDAAQLAVVQTSTSAPELPRASTVESIALLPLALSTSASAAPTPSDLERAGPNDPNSPETTDSGAVTDGATDSLDHAAPVSGAAWDVLWRARTGPVDPQYHSLIRGIISTVAEKQEWDKGWMLLLQAIMRRRVKDWFGDAGLHGGMYIPDAQTLLDRLRVARVKQDCHRDDVTIVAAVMVRGESRFLQEWLTWHLFVGYSHIVVYYEDPDDGTLDVIQPFVGASLVTAIHTHSVPGVHDSMATLESQIFRQRIVYDHSLRRLQSVACRYRGVGSPFSPDLSPCSTAELEEYYDVQHSQPAPKKHPAFVDPSNRPRDSSGSPLFGYKWSQHVTDQRRSRRSDAGSDARVIVKTPVPPVSHTLWLALPDSDEFMVPEPGLCMTTFLSSIATTHAAFGAPWVQMLPNDVLQPGHTLLMRDLTRRLERRMSRSMSKYITNVRYTLAVDVHYPLMMEPFALLDEGQGRINPERRNTDGVTVHDFGPHDGRKIWNHHYVARSLEAAVWKGVRQGLDDYGGGNLRSSKSVLDVALRVDLPDKSLSLPPDEPQAIRDDAAWRQSRAFMLTVLFGPAPQGWRYSGGVASSPTAG